VDEAGFRAGGLLKAPDIGHQIHCDIGAQDVEDLPLRLYRIDAATWPHDGGEGHRMGGPGP
jgi:hypothetical protein